MIGKMLNGWVEWSEIEGWMVKDDENLCIMSLPGDSFVTPMWYPYDIVQPHKVPYGRTVLFGG